MYLEDFPRNRFVKRVKAQRKTAPNLNDLNILNIPWFEGKAQGRAGKRKSANIAGTDGDASTRYVD